MNPSKAFRISVKTTLGTPVEWYRDTDMGQRWFKDLWGNIIIKGENTMAEKTHTRINQFNWKDGWIKEWRDNESKYANIKISENAQKTDEYKTQTHETIETFSVSN